MQNPIVVGLTGSFGAGCTSIAECLSSDGFKLHSLSRIVREKATEAKRGVFGGSLNPAQRRALQDFGDELRLQEAPSVRQVVDLLLHSCGFAGLAGLPEVPVPERQLLA